MPVPYDRHYAAYHPNTHGHGHGHGHGGGGYTAVFPPFHPAPEHYLAPHYSGQGQGQGHGPGLEYNAMSRSGSMTSFASALSEEGTCSDVGGSDGMWTPLGSPTYLPHGYAPAPAPGYEYEYGHGHGHEGYGPAYGPVYYGPKVYRLPPPGHGMKTLCAPREWVDGGAVPVHHVQSPSPTNHDHDDDDRAGPTSSV
jgi:hypothetical protein